MSSTEKPRTLPAAIGRYRIDGILGEGAMGVVYRGHDTELHRSVAVKTMRKDALADATGAELLARFRREAEAGIRLSHKHVVTVYEFGEDDKMAFMAMEFIEGRTLKELNAARAPWPLLEALDLAGQLLEALDFFHERGVVHRDIKPANIMVDGNGRLTVTDFGVARTQSSELTQVGTVLGTPAYMSPEQITGQPIDGRSDLFAVGTVLYEMLTGIKPFRGEMMTIAHNIVSNPHPEPSSLNGVLPPVIDRLFKRALAKKPDDRFQTGAEFREALRSMLSEILAAGEIPPPVPKSAPVPAPAPAAPPAQNAAPANPPAPPAAAGKPVPTEKKTFERCPKCGMRFDPPRQWNAICSGCGVALFEAATEPGVRKPAARPPQKAKAEGNGWLRWAVLAAALLLVVVLLLR